jgi:hypothetical protein
MPMKIIQKISFGLNIHPALAFVAKTPADFIALSNSQIHFTIIHNTANKLLKTKPWDSSNIFTKHPHIKIPDYFNTMWEVNKAAQATSLGQPLVKQNVIIGTQPQMLKLFPGVKFNGNQENPHVLSNFENSNFAFQGQIGTDWKNATAKTQPHGKNQVIIGPYERYQIIMLFYKEDFQKVFPQIAIEEITNQLLLYAKNNQFEEQVNYLATNQHKIPPFWNPPLYVNTKFPENGLTCEMKVLVAESKRKFRLLSQKAYEKNIPEDNFDQSHIQWLLAEFELI